jgi:hypothetical protein
MPVYRTMYARVYRPTTDKGPTVTHRYLFEIPAETFKELRRRCDRRGCTLRRYLLEAIAETGVDVPDLRTPATKETDNHADA